MTKVIYCATLIAILALDMAGRPSDPAAPSGYRVRPDAAGALSGTISLMTDSLVDVMVDSVSGPAIDFTVIHLQDFVTRYSTHDSCFAAAAYLRSRFESFGMDTVYLHHWSDEYADNVVAVLNGIGNPQKSIVIGGHYDSISSNPDSCPGADDNASGAAALFETARILSRYDFDYSIVFVAFSAEEQGSRGSEAFASEARDRGDDIVAMLNLDMIGYVAAGDVFDLHLVSNVQSMWLRDWVFDVGSLYVPDLQLVDAELTYGWSDHVSFWNNGFDAILVREDVDSPNPFMHTTNDIVGLGYQSPELARRATELVTAVAATLAEPFRVTIAHESLGDTEDPGRPHLVTARVLTAGTLDLDSLMVHYRTPAGAEAIPMTPRGTNDEYEALIPPQPAGTTVDYYLVAANTNGDRAVHPRGAPESRHRFTIGSVVPILEDDFESERGWTIGDIGDNATGGIWERADPNGTWTITTPIQPEDDHTADPGAMCFVTGNAMEGASPSADDVDNGRTTLLSPVYDLSSRSNAWVGYYRWFTNDTAGTPITDWWTVEVSADSGRTWVVIESDLSSDRSWRHVQRYLLDFVPLTDGVRFRFIATDEDPASIVEAAIDDFALFEYGENPDSPPDARRLVLYQNVPNPFNPVTTINFFIGGDGGYASLIVYDVGGRRVVTLIDREFVEGEAMVRWDGRDEHGRTVASGVYFYALEVGGEKVARKLVFLR